ncbi:DUF6705 family protein [uncultured Winogradskyella sp.]|uniref:DUF6705 family protein n=1 Tax=uncultured Winogradskyella sp. TaxID=395353 RepID=UPI002611B443|nr:DUF6705 family protein [uncultured Winogradskyella sp.]
MKKYITVITIIVCMLSCKAQSPIIPLGDRDVPDNLNGVYFKDVNNELDKFIGTWVYQNGDTSLTIELMKKIQVFNGRWYVDELLGEYKYIENGTELINYLPRLTDPDINDQQHSISGNKVVFPLNSPICTDCNPTEKRFILYFRDYTRRYLNTEILVQHLEDNGLEKIKIFVQGNGPVLLPEGAPETPTVPYGEYILIKQ